MGDYALSDRPWLSHFQLASLLSSFNGGGKVVEQRDSNAAARLKQAEKGVTSQSMDTEPSAFSREVWKQAHDVRAIVRAAKPESNCGHPSIAYELVPAPILQHAIQVEQGSFTFTPPSLATSTILSPSVVSRSRACR